MGGGGGGLLCMIILPQQLEVYGYVVSRRIIVISYMMQKQGCLHTFSFDLQGGVTIDRVGTRLYSVGIMLHPILFPEPCQLWTIYIINMEFLTSVWLRKFRLLE